MEVANRDYFLASLDRYPEPNKLEVFTHAKRHLLSAVAEVGFDDFRGRDYEILGRLSQALRSRGTGAALWGQVFIDLWYCSNFGGPHWTELVARDPANARYATQAAFWVFEVSGADGGPALASILNQCRCWEVAEQYVPRQSEDWWQQSVLPHRR
jgi:hypothetical protein